MSDLSELLKALTTSVETDDLTYVYYYSDSGEIFKISGVIDEVEEGQEILEVLYDIASPILTGEKRTTDFVVIYDTALKRKTLKEKNYQDTFKTASAMCYQIPVIAKSLAGHFSLSEIYEDVKVYIWVKELAYKKDDIVWYNDNVYKLLADNGKDKRWSKKNSKLFIENVFLSDIPTQKFSVLELKFEQQYKGIHVDVWYDDLNHLAGQHVWIGDCVYKILEDQPAHTNFNPKNAEMLVSNVALRNDTNKNLTFTQIIDDGKLYLDFNKIYSAKIIESHYDKSADDIVYHTDERHIIVCKKDFKIHMDTFDKKKFNYLKTDLTLQDQNTLKNGDKVLLGTKLYNVQLNKEFDIIVTQHTNEKFWQLNIHPSTLKYFQTTNYDQDDLLYFSITAKHDPNILYRSLKIPLSMLADKLVIPFKYDAEHKEDLSIYTAKYFDSYGHEIL
tara:strand:+ start:5983 stop:7317 length:1335 start_codon:yes stop_codon:yes gene_type:complete